MTYGVRVGLPRAAVDRKREQALAGRGLDRDKMRELGSSVVSRAGYVLRVFVPGLKAEARCVSRGLSHLSLSLSLFALVA